MSMMKEHSPSIIYFHGYGSSPVTDKVKVLREHFSDVQSFPIDPDPEKSLPFLEEEIDHYLASSINDERQLVMVGTSLGAWYAGYFAKMFYSPAVLINPYYSSKAAKIDVGLPKELAEKYDKIGFQFPEETRFFITLQDEVIDFTNFPMEHPNTWINYINTAKHRFNGPEFQSVIEYLKTFK